MSECLIIIFFEKVIGKYFDMRIILNYGYWVYIFIYYLLPKQVAQMPVGSQYVIS